MKLNRILLILILIITIGMTELFGREPNPNTLEIAIFPKHSSIETIKMYTPLINLLEKSLGKKIKLKIARSYRQHVEWMNNDEADIYFQNSLVTAKALDRIEVLCTANKEGKSTAPGVIVTLKDNSINSIEDLECTRLGVGPLNEEVAFQSVYIKLLTEGFDIREECKFNTVKTGKVKKLAQGLKQKRYSSIIVSKNDLQILNQVIGYGKYQIIYEGIELPESTFVTRKNLYLQTQNDLRDTLLDINSINVLKSILVDKFSIANVEEFEPLAYLTE